MQQHPASRLVTKALAQCQFIHIHPRHKRTPFFSLPYPPTLKPNLPRPIPFWDWRQRPVLPKTIPTPWAWSKTISTKRQTVPGGMMAAHQLSHRIVRGSSPRRARAAGGVEPPDTETASRQATERVSCRQGGGGQGETRGRTYGARQEARGQSAWRRTHARLGSTRRQAAAKSAVVRRHRATHQRGRRGLKAST